MAHFGSDTFQRTAYHCQGRKEDGMAVTRHDLRGNGLRGEAETGADESFSFRVNVREGADRAGDLTESDLSPGLDKARAVAGHLRVPVRGFEAEGNRLGVYPVRTADHHRVRVCLRQPLQYA